MNHGRVHTRRNYRIFGRLFSLVFALTALFPILANAEEVSQEDETKERDNTAYVYVIDSSSSMRYIFDDLKEIVKTAVTHCREDDRLSIVLFGDSVTTLVSYTTLSESKKKMASSILDSTSPESLYTNLGLAVKRGTECLHKYYAENLAQKYTLILVTDGKDHPPPGFARDYSIEDALTQFPDFLPGQQWSLRYIVLKGQIDAELLSLAKKYGGTFFDVDKISEFANATEGEVIASILGNIDDWDRLKAVVIKHEGEVLMKKPDQDYWFEISKDRPQEVFKGDRIKVGQDSEAVISLSDIGRIGVMENTEIGLDRLRELPLTKSTTIEFNLEGGSIWNSIDALPGSTLTYDVQTPIALTGVRGTVFKLSFDPTKSEQTIAVFEGSAEVSSLKDGGDFENFTVATGNYSTVSPTQGSSILESIPNRIVLEWTKWKGELIPATKLKPKPEKIIQICRYSREIGDYICEHVDTIAFGPLKHGIKLEEKLNLQFKDPKLLKGLAIYAATEIDLPEGVTCTAKFDMEKASEGKLGVLILVEVGSAIDLPFNMNWRGRLIFTSPDESIGFGQDGVVSLRMYTHPRRDMSPPKSPAPTIMERLRKIDWKLIKSYAILLALTICLFIIGRLARRTYFAIKPRPPGGWLLELHNPSETKLGNINLENLCHDSGKSTLVLGRKPESDICMSHYSVDRRHAKIYSKFEASSHKIFIKALGLSKVEVNFSPIYKIETELKDGDVIDMGECQFFFSTSHFQQVVVHYRNGRVRQGVLQTWNIEEKEFTLRPKDKSVSDPNIHVKFEDLKGVFFVKSFDREHAEKMKTSFRFAKKKRIVVEFLDGERIEGFVVGYFGPQLPRFYMAPKPKKDKEENTYLVLVERSFTRTVEAFDK